MPRHDNPKNSVATIEPTKKFKKRRPDKKPSVDVSTPNLDPLDNLSEREGESLPKTNLLQSDKRNNKKRRHCRKDEPTRSANDELETKRKRLKLGPSPLHSSTLSSSYRLMEEKKRKNQNISLIEPDTALSKDKVPHYSFNTSTSKSLTKRRQQRSNIGNLESNGDSSENDARIVENKMPYPHLRAVTKKISRYRIEDKWRALTPSCVHHISKLLQDVQRSAIASLDDGRKKQANLAVQAISRKISSKVSKGLPFPQYSRKNIDKDFDFEKTLDHSRSLESQLTPALHANKLLQSELRKELEYLKFEEDKLAELRTNAKKELALRNDTTKKLHPILREDNNEKQFEFEDLGLEPKSEVIEHPLVFDAHDRGKIATLTKEIHGHVVSLHNNIQQVEGVREAILRGKAALQATLFNHLKDEEYNDVVLGLE